MDNCNLRNDLLLYFDFYIVAKEGNFTKAAIKYFLSQPNLSRNIKLLEEKLSLDLCIKNNKGIVLTLDGERLYKQLDPIFSELSKALYTENEKDFNTSIVIGSTRNISDFKLEKYLSNFIKVYPSVKLNIITDSATNLNNYLINHKIDILIDYLPQINNSEKYNFEVKAIDQFQTCFACSKKFYNKIYKDIKQLRDLNNYKLVIPGSSRRRQILDMMLQENNIKLNDCSTMPDSKLMKNFVCNNDYIGYFTNEELNDSELVEIKMKEEMPINSIGLIYHKSSINEVTKKFVELIVNEQ